MGFSGISNNYGLNVSAMYYNKSTKALNKSAEKITSGKRILSAADDASGLIMSERMKSQINGLKVGTNNLNNTLSMVTVADKALEDITGLAQQIAENYTKLGDASLSADDKTIIESNITELASQISEIGTNTKYNNQTVFTETAMNIQSGANATDKMTLTIGALGGATGLDFTDATKAQASLDSLLGQRGKIGAYERGIEAKINVNENSTTQLEDAVSRITDVDVAKETIEYNKQYLLQQTSLAMMQKQSQNQLSILNLLA